MRVRASSRLTRVELSSRAMRTARSTPSSARSARRSERFTSSTTRGCARRNAPQASARCWMPKLTGTLARSTPTASRLRLLISPSASARSASNCRARAWKTSPSSVSDSLRVVRCSRRTPRRPSSSATWREMAALDRPRRSAAATKLPASTTSAKERSSRNRSIVLPSETLIPIGACLSCAARQLHWMRGRACGQKESAMPSAPVLFISHGAPTFALQPGLLGPRLQAAGAQLPRPRAVLVVSPHWMTRGVRVATTAAPATVHDFGGFDPALYRIEYPAHGAPEIAARTIEVLRAAGWPAQADEAQGLDHGTWVPLCFLYPQADVPVFQVSLPAGLTPAQAYALGKALTPLRDEGVMVVGSGSLTHNLYEFRMDGGGEDAAYAREFAAWVRQAVEARDNARLQQTLELAPHAKRAHPTAEHFLPLLVAAGAASGEAKVQTLEGGITYGVLAMDSYLFEARVAEGPQ